MMRGLVIGLVVGALVLALAPKAEAHTLKRSDAAEFVAFKLWSIQHANADITKCRRVSRHTVVCLYQDFVGAVTCYGRARIRSPRPGRYHVSFKVEDCYGPALDFDYQAVD